MTRDLVIGLDIGTTGCKAVAVDSAGRVCATSGGTYPLHQPRPGWVEQDVREIWPAVAAALRQVAERIDAKRVAALALSGAMHSLMVADRRDQALSPALTWADTRAAAEAAQLRASPEAGELYRRTGCPLQAAYHPARLRHWMNNTPAIGDGLFVGIKDWALHRLTGRWAMDLSMASATGLLDLETLTWHSGALAAAGVTAARLPELLPPEAIAGTLSDAAAGECGLPTGLPVVAGASDGALANLGSGAVRPEDVVVSIGTSGAVRRLVARPVVDHSGGRTWCYVAAGGGYFCGGAINNGGLALQWVKQTLYADAPGDAYQVLADEAAQIEPGADGLLLLPYFTGERSPHWSSDARAAAVGLTLAHTRGHVARAAMEGVAFCLADVCEAAAPELASTKSAVRLTGGITRLGVWMQIVADVLGVNLRATEAADASALGAALLGHWAVGNLSNLQEGADHLPQGAPVMFDPRRHETYRQLHRRFQETGRELMFGARP